MIIIKDIRYTVEDALDQVKSELGFSFERDSSSSGEVLSGYFVVSPGITLDAEFDTMNNSVDSLSLTFPDNVIDILKSKDKVEMYSTSLESASQVVDLINKMLGSDNDEDS